MDIHGTDENSIGDTNPYLPPQDRATNSTDSVTSSGYRYRRLIAAWIGVFTLNTVVPGLCALQMDGMFGASRSEVMIGIIIGCGVLLPIGLMLCLKKPGLMSAVVIGGLLISLTQFFPVLQMVAGLIALICSAELAGMAPVVPFVEYSFAVLMTAGIMLAIAAMTGGVVRVIFGEWRLFQEPVSESEHTYGER